MGQAALREQEVGFAFEICIGDAIPQQAVLQIDQRSRSSRKIPWTNFIRVSLDVSVEDKKYGLPHIAAIQLAAAAVRFLSIEPLLEDLGEINLQGIHWVIVGGESGHDARPMEESWVLHIKRQCDSADVPFFFKQWGDVEK